MTNDNRLIHLERSDEKPQMADWLAKLDRGELSDEEQQAFKQWLEEAPGNKKAIQEAADFWYGLNEPLSQLLDVTRGTSTASPVSRLLIPLRGLTYVAVSALLLSIATFYLLPDKAEQKQSYYATQIGETKVVPLQDGSQIHLNTNTIIEQNFSGKERIVKLLSGEAIFDVAHDKKRPFKVYASDEIIRAVGTRFAVRLRPDKVSVTVTEGRVALEKPDSAMNNNQGQTKLNEIMHVIVSQGEAADIAHGTGHAKRSVSERDLAEQLAWAQGQLVFYDKELQFVIDEVTRYTRVEITVGDESLKIQKITGILQLGDVRLMIEGIEGALGVKASWLSENHVHITSG